MQPLSKSISAMQPHVIDPSIFRAYDIRGIYGQTLNVADAYAIARAFAVDLLSRGGKTVCIAYDVRLSSPELESAIVQGLMESGIDVTRVGIMQLTPYYEKQL